MPRIPQYIAQVSPASAPTPNAPPNALGYVGENAVRLGATLQARDAEEQRLLEQQQQRQGNLWLAKATAELRSQSTMALIEAQKTAPADGAGFTQAQLEAYRERYQTMAAGAPSAEFAQEFEIRSLGIYDDILATATGYEAALHGQAVKTAYGETVNQYAATIRADPSQFEGALANNLAAIERLDLTAEQRAGLAATTRETLGLAYFNARLDADPVGVREEILAGGPAALTLDSAKREQVLGAADVEIRRRQAEARQRAAEQRAIDAYHAGNRIDDEQAAAAAGGTTGLVTDNDWQLAYGEGWQQAKANLEATRGVAVAATELALVPPSQWQATIDAAAPAPEGAGYKAEGARRDFLTAAAADLAKELDADPALYVARHSPEVAAAFAGAGQDPAKLQQAVALSLAVQERLEVPAAERRALSTDQAKDLAQRIATAEPTQMLGAIDGLAQGYGPHWPKIAGELVAAGLPAPAAAIVTFDNDRILQHEIAVALPIGEATLKNALTKEALTQIEDRIAGNLEPVLATMPAAVRAPYVSAIHLAALSFAQRMDPTAAADRATQGLTARYQVAGDYRVPLAYDGGLVEAGLDRYLAELERIDMGGGDPTLPEADRVAAGIDAIRDDHHWINNYDESGVVLTDQNWVPVYRGGKPIEVNFTLAEQLGNAAPARRNAPAGVASLGLNAQEQYLYDYHRRNLENVGSGGVRNPDGSISTVRNITVERDGRHYVIPTVWEGKVLGNREAIERAGRAGWSKWPSYATAEEAETRYQAMHRFMDADASAP